VTGATIVNFSDPCDELIIFVAGTATVEFDHPTVHRPPRKLNAGDYIGLSLSPLYLSTTTSLITLLITPLLTTYHHLTLFITPLPTTYNYKVSLYPSSSLTSSCLCVYVCVCVRAPSACMER
jgi:hypothetical protein